MAVTFDVSSLLGYYQARSALSGLTTGGATSGATASSKKYAPTPPWSSSSGATRASDLVRGALSGKRFVDEGAAKLDLPGASSDYKKLFALYQGLNTLYGLGERMQVAGLASTEQSRLTSLFAKGLKEVVAYTDGLELEQMRLTRGKVMSSDKTAVGAPRASYQYVTPVVHSGERDEAVAAFQGAVAFDIAVKRGAVTHTIAVDLADMGSTPRTMGDVAAFINAKLEAEGLQTRFAVQRTAGAPREIEAGGTKVTLPALEDDYAFKITGDSTEQVTFSAATAAPAVYVATWAGDPDPDDDVDTDDGVFQAGLTKIDGSTVGTEGARIRSGTLEGTVAAVRASKVGPDGALYMLADVETSIDGQTVKGERDVALLKYDSAGQLMYARTLGASSEAQGLALDVAADGKVAIAGQVTGRLGGTTDGPINSGATSDKTDSFVTLLDAAGDEVWTVRRGALQDDEASDVAIAADGTVYVAGRAKSTVGGASGAIGGWDAYLTAISTNATTGAATTLFTQQLGTTGDDRVGGLVVDGTTVTLATVEGVEGVLRSYDVSGGSPVALATRNLGDLEGGDIAGLSLDGGYLWVGGQTRNAALSVGTETRAHAGGMDGFAARVATDLSDVSADRLAYFGGAGNDSVAAMTVSGGKVWLAGGAAEDLPGSDPIGTKDGFLAALDVAAGTVSAQRLTGKDGIASAVSIAVDATGASALDRLGLPKGTLLYADSVKVVSATSARAGDTFQIRTAEGGRLATVTIEAKDTFDTLATKIRRAGGYHSKVEVVSEGAFRRIKISPANTASTVEILPGKGGTDVLEALGLATGVVRGTTVDRSGKTVSADGGGPMFGIELPGEIDVGSDLAVKAALATLDRSLGKIRTAYRELEAAANPAKAQTAAPTGVAPAYLTNQIANYQAALDRLTGG